MFLDTFYLQIFGTAMGASFASSLANLFMSWWEAEAIWGNNPYKKHIIYYGRYIDYVLVIWDGDRLSKKFPRLL